MTTVGQRVLVGLTGQCVLVWLGVLLGQRVPIPVVLVGVADGQRVAVARSVTVGQRVLVAATAAAELFNGLMKTVIRINGISEVTRIIEEDFFITIILSIRKDPISAFILACG